MVRNDFIPWLAGTGSPATRLTTDDTLRPLAAQSENKTFLLVAGLIGWAGAERSRICSDLCCGGRGLGDHQGITASLIHANLWISQGRVQVQGQAARCVYFKLVSPCYECFVLELGCCGCVQMLLSRPSNNTNTRHGRSADLITDTLVTNISAILPGVSLYADRGRGTWCLCAVKVE